MYFKKIFIITFIFFTSYVMSAQIALKLQLNRSQYLTYENIYAKLTLRNMSGRPLVFGNNPKFEGNLQFDIIGPNGIKAPLINKKQSPLLGKVIPPGVSEILVIQLSKMYKIRKDGEYVIKAIISHSQLSDKYQSNKLHFTITRGVTLWKRTVGIPTIESLNKDTKIESRNYKIISFYDGKDKVYCLVVEDEKYVYGVARIGYDIGADKPQCEVDRLSKIHILIQSSPEIFSYYVYDNGCRLENKKVYRKTNSTPTLRRNSEAGDIVVSGGEKALQGSDYQEINENNYN